MLAIAVNMLYTVLRKRGTTRQLAGSIMTCVISALLLLLAIFWYNVRFSSGQAAISVVEVTLALVYVALWGWVLPMSVTVSYCLFTKLRDSNTSVRIPLPYKQTKRATRGDVVAGKPSLPRRQPGVPAPFVFSKDIAWGWLEHRAGRFQGQKLALHRAVVTIGREEDNEIWLDDETSSRYHAELAWQGGQAYISDCDSLNGVLLNGRRVRGTLVIKSGDLLEIGAHRFLFEMAERPTPLNDQDDPLSHHLRRPITLDNVDRDMPHRSGKTPAGANVLPTKPLDEEDASGFDSFKLEGAVRHLPHSTPGEIDVEPGSIDAWEDTAALDPVAPLPQSDRPGSLCVICNGELVGRSFLLDRPVLIVGRSEESDVILPDASISRRHAQFSRQAYGDYVQDLASRNGTKVNDELLNAPRLLQKGDIIYLGNVRLEYTFIPEAQTTSLPPLPMPPLARPISGPMPLRLPSKPK